jgi:hypothetical protein
MSLKAAIKLARFPMFTLRPGIIEIAPDVQIISHPPPPVFRTLLAGPIKLPLQSSSIALPFVRRRPLAHEIRDVLFTPNHFRFA